MKRRDLFSILPFAAGAGWVAAQTPDIGGVITKVATPHLAIPDFAGNGVPPEVADAVNQTVWNDLADSGVLELVAKTSYPLEVPRTAASVNMKEWSGAPVLATHLGIGDVRGQGPDLILRGWLLLTQFEDVRKAQLLDKSYFAALTVDGGRKVGHEYAADILQLMGAKSLAGSKIYFVSDRTSTAGNAVKELWSMDHNGQNQQLLIRHGSIVKNPAVSLDGRLLAYVLKNPLGWEIKIRDTVTGRPHDFLNPPPTTVIAPEVSPDNKKLWFSMALEGNGNPLMVANLDGSNRRRISTGRSIEVSPRLNPRNPEEVLFISGRLGHPQLYRMKADGTGEELLTDGTGDVANPAWSPDGRSIAFAWTRGNAPGGFNIFVMDANGKNRVQLTHGTIGNENPWWAPDGVHLVFSSDRTGRPQIYSMLADGTRVKQLTSVGDNTQPAWAAKTE